MKNQIFHWLIQFSLVFGIPGIRSPLFSQDSTQTPIPLEWSDPSQIDPLRGDIVNFLSQNPDYYRALALQSYRQNQFYNAAQYYLFYLRGHPQDRLSLYNLACCYARLGHAAHAAEFLWLAFRAGFTDIEKIKQDADFKQARSNPRFKETFKQIEAETQKAGKVVYVQASKLLPCRVRLPVAFNSKRRYPLLIVLHGNGGSGENMLAAFNEVTVDDFILAAPQGPYLRTDLQSGHGQNFSWEIQVKDEALWQRGDPLSVAYILEVARTLAEQYPVNGIYLLGHSQGAAYAYTTGIKNPEIFKGILALAGMLPPTDSSSTLLTLADLQTAKKAPILIAHGQQDQAINIEISVQAQQKLKSYDYDVTFIRFEGGHSMPANVLNLAVAWIRQQNQE
ncbi:hypothetical protein L0128_21980 [candidate division KSB1 bacterium]|nr:hypothetical protein [candidate division KSB1 bacterium]